MELTFNILLLLAFLLYFVGFSTIVVKTIRGRRQLPTQEAPLYCSQCQAAIHSGPKPIQARPNN